MWWSNGKSRVTEGARALEDDVIALLERCNVAGPSSLVVPSEYLEVVVVRARALH